MSLQIQLSWFGVNNLSFRNKMYHDTDTAVLVLSKLKPAGSVAIHHSILFSGLSSGCTVVTCWPAQHTLGRGSREWNFIVDREVVQLLEALGSLPAF